LSDDLELFDRFNTEMYREYMRHYPKNRDSWKTCDKGRLFDLLFKSVNKSQPEMERNPSHFIDIANFALFCYYSFCTERKVEK
jgi:hypothetical protein